MKRVLLPAGFVIGKEGTYLRRSGDQIHLIRFDTKQSAPHVSLTLGFQYSYVPTQQVKQIALQHLHFLDCLIYTEASQLLATICRDKFCSELREDMILDLEESASQALSVLDKYAVRWREAADFLTDAAEHKKWMHHSAPNPIGLACVALRCGNLELAEKLLGQFNEAEQSAGWLRPRIDWFRELVLRHRYAMNAGLELPSMPDWYTDNSE